MRIALDVQHRGWALISPCYNHVSKNAGRDQMLSVHKPLFASIVLVSLMFRTPPIAYSFHERFLGVDGQVQMEFGAGKTQRLFV